MPRIAQRPLHDPYQPTFIYPYMYGQIHVHTDTGIHTYIPAYAYISYIQIACIHMYSRRYGHAYFQQIIQLMLYFLLNRHKEVKIRASNRLSITYPKGITQEVSDAYIAHTSLYESHQTISSHPNAADPARHKAGQAQGWPKNCT